LCGCTYLHAHAAAGVGLKNGSMSLYGCKCLHIHTPTHTLTHTHTHSVKEGCMYIRTCLHCWPGVLYYSNMINILALHKHSCGLQKFDHSSGILAFVIILLS
jgi:hypothetical protein